VIARLLAIAHVIVGSLVVLRIEDCGLRICCGLIQSINQSINQSAIANRQSVNKSAILNPQSAMCSLFWIND